MTSDPSRGWDSIAEKFMAVRSANGADIVRQWSKHLRPTGSVVDIGCGSGVPISEALIAQGFEVLGIDASPTLLSAFRRRFPKAEAVCEQAETSSLFARKFDGAVAVGLIFLLPEESQRSVIARVGRALMPEGRFLFSAPSSPCKWNDGLTGRPSLSLGRAEYERLLVGEGMRLVDSFVDEGGNHYCDAVKNAA